MILPGVELKIFDLGVGELPPGLTLNRGGKMTKISSWGGKFFFSLAVLKSCPCMKTRFNLQMKKGVEIKDSSKSCQQEKEAAKFYIVN